MSMKKFEISPQALQLISDQPELWEFRLFGQVMIDDIKRIDEIFKHRHAPNLEKISSTTEYLSVWLRNKLNEVQVVISELSDLLHSNHDDAFGPPGFSGNSDNIITYSRRIVSFYYLSIMLLQSIENTSVNSDCHDTHKEFALAVSDITKNIRTFGSNILQQIEDIVNTSETGEKRVLRLTLNLSIRESFTDALNRLTTTESKKLSELTERMNLAVDHLEKNQPQNNSNESGYIYVLFNPSTQDIVKIGKTQRNPDERAKELSSATGVPTPFIIVYQAYFGDCNKAEKFVHSKLDKYRVANNREFFKVAIPIAIDTIIEAKKFFPKSEDGLDSTNNTQNNNLAFLDLLAIDNNKPKDPGKEFFDLGNAYYYGLNETIQDDHEAFSYYKKAALFGHSEAFLQMGIMCHLGEGQEPNNQRALGYFKEAVRHGNDEAWAEMAKIYNIERHRDNEAKCWNKYFTSKNFLQFSFRRQMRIYNYVSNAISQNEPIEYKDQIREIKSEVLKAIIEYAKTAEERGVSSLIEKHRKTFMTIKDI